MADGAGTNAPVRSRREKVKLTICLELFLPYPAMCSAFSWSHGGCEADDVTEAGNDKQAYHQLLRMCASKPEVECSFHPVDTVIQRKSRQQQDPLLDCVPVREGQCAKKKGERDGMDLKSDVRSIGYGGVRRSCTGNSSVFSSAGSDMHQCYVYRLQLLLI